MANYKNGLRNMGKLQQKASFAAIVQQKMLFLFWGRCGTL